MRLLLDTHVLLWMLSDPERLSRKTRAMLDDDRTAVSASIVSLWEIAMKRRLGKLEADPGEVAGLLAPASKVALLAITVGHLAELGRLPVHPAHRDPYDHLLIAQAISEGMAFVTADRNASLYGARTIAP